MSTTTKKTISPLIVLASGSASRKQQLTELGFAFTIKISGVDEEFYKNKNSCMSDICQQIAKAKVKKVSKKFSPDTLILGGDQMAVLGSKIFNKPDCENKAIKSLTQLQGKTHQLFTALYMCYKGKTFSYLEVNNMHMRTLTLSQITNYVHIAKPMNCAGSYAIERYGIALFTKIDTKDYSAIMGFPLLTLINQMVKWDIPLPFMTQP